MMSNGGILDQTSAHPFPTGSVTTRILSNTVVLIPTVSLVDNPALGIIKRLNMQVSTVKRLEGLQKDSKQEQYLHDIIIKFICISASHIYLGIYTKLV
jgi:hypothetical protein